MSTRGTLKYYYIKIFGIYIFEIHIYDETAKHSLKYQFVPYIAISFFNREVINMPFGRKTGYFEEALLEEKRKIMENNSKGQN